MGSQVFVRLKMTLRRSHHIVLLTLPSASISPKSYDRCSSRAFRPYRYTQHQTGNLRLSFSRLSALHDASQYGRDDLAGSRQPPARR